MNKIGNRKIIQKIDETTSGFYWKTNRIDKSLARLTKRKSTKIQIQRIRKEVGYYYWHYRNKKNDKGIQWLIICQKLYTWDGADKDLETHKLLK